MASKVMQPNGSGTVKQDAANGFASTKPKAARYQKEVLEAHLFLLIYINYPDNGIVRKIPKLAHDTKFSHSSKTP